MRACWLLAQDEISLGSSERGVTIILRVDDLRRAMREVNVARLTKE